jgi:hypothetical protein
MTVLRNYRFPKFMDAGNTIIELTVDHEVYGTIPFSTNKGEELFARAAQGEFGTIQPFIPEVLPPERLQALVENERLRRVNEAYISSEKRMSVYGYFARIASTPEAERTEEQLADLETLRLSDEWEAQMIARAPIVVGLNNQDAIYRDNSWPVNPVAQALRELASQC